MDRARCDCSWASAAHSPDAPRSGHTGRRGRGGAGRGCRQRGPGGAGGGTCYGPRTPTSPTIHRFLPPCPPPASTARRAGGIDPDGRERLLFIEGDVPVPPSRWSQTDVTLAWSPRCCAGSTRTSGSSTSPGPTWSASWPTPPADRWSATTTSASRTWSSATAGRRAARLRLRRAGPPRLRPRADGPHVRARRRPARRRPSASRPPPPAPRSGWLPTLRGRRRLRRELSPSLVRWIARGGEFVRRALRGGRADFMKMLKSWVAWRASSAAGAGGTSSATGSRPALD